MSEEAPAGNAAGTPRTARSVVSAVYVLYLTFFFVPAIAGVILAYLKRGDSDPVSETHLTFQIRTFWIGLAAAVVGFITTAIGIGFLILIALAVWVVGRAVTGILANSEDRAIDDPETWFW